MNKILIIVFALMLVIILTANCILHHAVKQFKEDYAKPDTTIIYSNGKWDTTITIKQLPSWLK